MPHLHYSNHLESLVVPLAQALETRDPLETVDIVVPNYSLEKWISLKIAQTNGIAANLRFITLEKAIFEGFKDKLIGRNFDLLKKETIQCLLQEILREKIETTDQIWRSLKNYISPQVNINHKAKEHRLFQLSERLTNLFQEYEFSRNEELIYFWSLGKNAIDISGQGTESWQKELWHGLFGPQGKITKYNNKIRESTEPISTPELYTLSQIYRICQINHDSEKYESFTKNSDSNQKALHIFGVSYLSNFHQKALTDYLSKFREINVYSLNPCMEFWEDVKSLRESKIEILKKIESKKTCFSSEGNFSEKEFLLGEAIKYEDDNPFLEVWGRPGRENIRLLNQWSNWDFTPWFIQNNSIFTDSKNLPNEGNNLLNQLQQDILFREPRRVKSLDMKQDESIMVLACSNPRREVEAVANLIWDWIQNDPDLMLNECAVIANNMDVYQHEIEQVFEEIYNLPFHLIDGFSSEASRLEDAANDLLGLCFTDYNRKDLFDLIKNPFFVGIFEDSSIETNVAHGESLDFNKWMEWADDLNIFYGIDGEWNTKNGYLHLKDDTYSWEQAFNRITTGELLSLKNDTGTFTIGNKKIIPAKIPQEWSLEAARFSLIVRSLIADTRYLPKWEMSAKDWSNYLQILIKTYLKNSEKIDQEAFQNLLRNTQAISDLDLGQEKGHKFNFDTIIEFFKHKQSSIKIHRGHYLAEGITVSSFKPMRPIPFKAVFLLGLGEGLFPTTFKKDTLDLRQIPEKLSPPIEGRNFRERRIGDVSETERDQYMFLETLISTRKHLVLSYVCHNERNDDKLNPSSIIQTLVDELNKGYLKYKFEETIHPLKSYSLSYFPELTSFKGKNSKSILKLPNYNFSSFSQARSYQLRKLFDKEFPGFERISPELFSPKIKKIFETNLVPSKRILPDSENIFKLSITNLRKFLESPLQSSISRLIYYNQVKENTFPKIEEPFILERLNEWELLRKIWDHALRIPKNNISLEEGPEWESLYLNFTKRMELEGKMPSSFFKIAMQEKHLKILNNWNKQLTSILNTDWHTVQKKMYKFHFGPIKKGIFNSDIPYNHIPKPTISIGNSSFKLGNLSIQIRGSSEWWYSDKQNNWYVIYLNEKENLEKTWLRHFLDILCLQISGIFSKKAKVSAICISSEEKFKLREIKIPSEKEVQKYIFDIVQDMQHENAAEILPIESILALAKENLDEANYNNRYYNWIESKLSLNVENLDISSKFGPVNFLDDFSYPKNPYKIMKRRFDLFFKTILS